MGGDGDGGGDKKKGGRGVFKGRGRWDGGGDVGCLVLRANDLNFISIRANLTHI